MLEKHGRFEYGEYSYLYEIAVIEKSDLNRWVSLNPTGSENDFAVGAKIKRMEDLKTFIVIRTERERIFATQIDGYSEKFKEKVD